MFAALGRKLFGTQNDRLVKAYRKTVDKVNALEPTIHQLSDAELRAQTDKFRGLLANGSTLNDILPEAFATVREASTRVMGMRHFDVQMIGGAALNDGYIPEMRTGEGKTLVATLPVYLNAIEGKGVHVVTVNDYLAKRDSEWMRPLYEFLGLSVGCIVSNLSEDERRTAYAADITYGTNNEFGFDYLRDNMKFQLEDMVQRPFNFAIVDEVDSILIDEARTPLIISGAAQDSAELYNSVNRIIPKLVPDDYELDEKNKNIALTDIGSEHAEEILRELGILTEGGLFDTGNIYLMHHVNQALRAHKMFARDVDYIVKDDAVIIIDEFTGRMMEGRRYSEGLHQALEAKEGVSVQNESQTLASITFQNFFRMYPKLAGMTGTALTEKAEFETIYNLRVLEIPTNLPQIRLDHHDEIYRTAAEKYLAIIHLIEECRERQQPVLVGTTSIEKSELLSSLLKEHKIPHNVLNARYHEQEAYIIAQAGRVGAVTIATNMAGRGTDIKLGGNLEMRLQQEIPADATPEQRDQLTTKIRAEIETAYNIVKNAGGLFVVGSERHESRRIDNQLRGRSGRQGDPGASKFFISLEDDLLRIFGSEKMDAVLKALGLQEGQAIIHPWINTAIEKAQKKVENQHFEVRKSLLRMDNVMNDQRKVIYDQRRDIMQSSDLGEMIIDMRHEVVDVMTAHSLPPGSYADQWDVIGLKNDVFRLLGIHLPIEQWVKEEGIEEHQINTRIKQAIDGLLTARESIITPETMRRLEKNVLLRTLDYVWKEHLQNLDHLRQGIFLRAIGQKDPFNEYRTEAFTLFQGMLESLRESVTSDLCRIELHVSAEGSLSLVTPPKNPAPESLHMSKPEVADILAPQTINQEPLTFAIPTVDKDDPATWDNTPRNAACPCGSGKKFKYCHGKIAQG